MKLVATVTLAPSGSLASDLVGRASVIDGDTIEVCATTIRLNGIDAPEHWQNCGKWRCGVAATDALAALGDGVVLRCEAGSLDGYGRVIARCWAGVTDIGARMVRDRLAWAFAHYSDV